MPLRRCSAASTLSRAQSRLTRAALQSSSRRSRRCRPSLFSHSSASAAVFGSPGGRPSPSCPGSSCAASPATSPELSLRRVPTASSSMSLLASDDVSLLAGSARRSHAHSRHSIETPALEPDPSPLPSAGRRGAAPPREPRGRSARGGAPTRSCSRSRRRTDVASSLGRPILTCCTRTRSGLSARSSIEFGSSSRRRHGRSRRRAHAQRAA